MSYLVQGYRGIAALLVLLFHTSGITAAYFHEQNALTLFFEFGRAGVEFFFVLSGFIMYMVHNKDFSNQGRLQSYFFKRIIRIYPIYILITLVITPIFFLSGSYGESYHRELIPLIKSLLLIPQSDLPHLGVGWSLVHEVMFYIIFALFIINKKAGTTICFFWAIAIIIFYVLTAPNFDGGGEGYFWKILFSRYNMLFICGMIVAYVLVNHSVKDRYAILAFITGNVLFLISGMILGQQETEIATVFFGLSSCLILFACYNTFLEQKIKNIRILEHLGKASYSIYLTHTFCISFLCKVIAYFEINQYLSLIFMYFLIAIITILFGLIFFKYIEKPLSYQLKNRLNNKIL